jgi:hypothetical protein
MTFLYLVPTGMNDPLQPTWGSWAGRYGPNEKFPGRPYFWANQRDQWNGTAGRDNTLRRWAAHLQNDFRARLDWCVKEYDDANHPPAVKVEPAATAVVAPGQRVTVDATGSTDPDGDPLQFEWTWYPEAGTYRGPPPALEPSAGGARVSFAAPVVDAACTAHLIATVTDDGSPPLTRYHRLVVSVRPNDGNP